MALVALGTTAALAASMLPLPRQDAAAPARRIELPDWSLAVELDALEGFTEPAEPLDTSGTPLRGRWFGKLGASDVRLDLWAFEAGEFGVQSPEDVLELVERHHAAQQPKDKLLAGEIAAFQFEDTSTVAGPYGFAPWARVGVHTEHLETKPVATTFVWCGSTQVGGYALEVSAKPPLGDAERERLLAFLREHVRYTGDVQLAEWADEELERRWREGVPTDLVDDLEIERTEHYVFLTNASGGKNFAKAMEKNYETIRKLYEFEDVPGQRLLPVFLFTTPDQYYDSTTRMIGWPREQAERSKGVAYQDFYATWYEAPQDDVHIHEATHQIFRMRLRLSGGGSWFQEGVAEYVSTRKNDRNVFRNEVKRERYVPLRTFMEVPSLLLSNEGQRKEGGSEASNQYLQAACVIEFVHQSKFGKDRFREFIHAVGSAPRGDVTAIDAALNAVFGVTIDGFEEEFVAYWKKR